MGAFTFYTIVYGLTSPVAGRMIEKYGAKTIITTGAILTAVGLVLLSFINSMIDLYIGYMLVGIGTTCTGPVCSSFVVSQWFQLRRGTAIGIMSMGISTSGILFAPFVAVILIPYLGWNNTYLTIALINLGVIVPLAQFIIQTRPEEMGMFPDGAKGAPETNTLIEKRSNESQNIPLKAALLTSAFWFIGISLTFNHTHLGVYVSIFPHLTGMGFPVKIAASSLSITSMLAFSGMFSFGWLCDRIKAKYASVIGLCFIILGALIFTFINSESPVWFIWLFAAFFGFGIGSWMPTMSMLTSSTFGLSSYGTIFGALSIFQNLGGGIGPLIAGYTYDMTSSYRMAAIVLIVLIVLAIPLILAVKKPRILVKND